MEDFADGLDEPGLIDLGIRQPEKYMAQTPPAAVFSEEEDEEDDDRDTGDVDTPPPRRCEVMTVLFTAHFPSQCW